jgi:hypothetical protein
MAKNWLSNWLSNGSAYDDAQYNTPDSKLKRFLSGEGGGAPDPRMKGKDSDTLKKPGTVPNANMKVAQKVAGAISSAGFDALDPKAQQAKLREFLKSSSGKGYMFSVDSPTGQAAIQHAAELAKSKSVSSAVSPGAVSKNWLA